MRQKTKNLQEKISRQRRAFQRGIKKMTRLARLSAKVDAFMTAASRPLGMCAEKWGDKFGKWNKFSRRFAKIFWTECPCCLFYRGMTIGAAFAAGIAVLAQLCVIFIH